MNSVPVVKGIFLCIHMGWGKCPLLSALVSWPDTTLGVGKGIAVGLEAAAEHNYPTSTTFHAQRLLPRCSDTRLLFFFFFFLAFLIFFFLWNLKCELQNTKQLWLWLPLWVPFPPPVVTGSQGKAKAVRSLQKKREISAGRVCMRQLICCEVWVPCSCWCDLLM